MTPGPQQPLSSERSSRQSALTAEVVWASSWGSPAARLHLGLQAHLLWVGSPPPPPPLDEGPVADRGSSTGRRGGVGPCVAHVAWGTADQLHLPPCLAWDAGPPQPAVHEAQGCCGPATSLTL